MSAASYASVRRAVARGDLAPVYYVTGEEEILKDELVDAIVGQALEPAARDFNLDVRSAGDLNGETFHTLVETPPMLAERRVAVVKGLEQWRKNSKTWRVLFDYVERPAPTTTLVLVLGAGADPDRKLADHATHVVVSAPDADAVRDWALERATRLGFTLSRDGAAHLIEAVGASLSHAATELAKLGAAADGDQVGREEVERFVGVRHGETLSDWVDAAARRDTTHAIRLLEIVLPQPGMTGVKMLNALGTAIVGARLARGYADQRKDARQVKDALWHYLKQTRPRGLGRYSDEIDRWMGVAPRWRRRELDRALRIMFEADVQLKSTTLSDPRATLTTMLLRFGQPEEAA